MHASRSLWSGSVASVALALLALACGGGGAKAPAPARDGATGADAGAPPSAATSAPPAGLPPMATMPPPGVAGSKKARRRHDAALASCVASSRAQAKDPKGAVKALAGACAQTSKAKPASAVLGGQQADRDAHQEGRFRAEAGRCYRVYAASDEGARDVVVVLRDSAGDVVAEGPAPAIPNDGTVCFTAPDDVTVLVGVGSGEGAWAAQVWGE